MAVGAYIDNFSAIPSRPALLTWTHGTWTIVTGLPIDFVHGGIACVTVADCTVVGESGVRFDGFSTATALHWNGTEASSVPAYEPPGWSSFFTAVACPSEGGCVAVGGQEFRDGPFFEAQPLMETSAGGSFALSATPPPAGPGSAGFGAISCPTSSDCVAVGSAASPINERSEGDADSVPYAARWDGARWRVRSPARTPGQKAFLDAVSCPSSTACVAVGGTEPVSAFQAQFTPLAERWNGSGWTTLPVPDGLSGQWTGVSCVSARYCVAVGSGAFEVWDGSSWTAQPQANAGDTLDAVSCSAVDACTAVGWANGPVAFVERWDGTAWREQAPSAQAPFAAVSCAAADACQAVSLSPFQAMGYDGTAWANEPVPASTPGSDIRGGIDCAAPASCEAVGGTPFAVGWDGTSWRRQWLPAKLQGSGLDAVSCPTRTACFAVGSGTTALARYVSPARSAATRVRLPRSRRR